jgi:AraC-like DNA-binding protein
LARNDPRNRARYWSDCRFPGLNCLAADFTDHDYAPHRHDALVVAVTEAGGSEFKSRGVTDEAKSSVLLVFNPDEPHSGRMARSRRWRYRSFYLAMPALQKMMESLGVDGVPYFRSNVLYDEDLIGSFLALHRSLDGGGDLLEREEVLTASFGDLIQRHGEDGRRIAVARREHAGVAKLIEVMRARYDEDLRLGALAAEIGLTPFQLIGAFKSTTGLAPYAFLTQLRLEAAAAEMKAGMPIAEAALAAGFYDQSALTTHFKRAYGITPLQWLKAA